MFRRRQTKPCDTPGTEGYWVPGLSHGTDCMEKAKEHPSFMMSQQLYLGQELLSEEGLESALPGARPRGEGQLCWARKQTPPTSTIVSEPHQ